tara:strand:+ start:993 stop:2213 length:1221 start_codon:yes stop_codon:yes gene_type:complete
MIASSPDHSLKDVIFNALKDTHPPLFDVILFWSLKLSGNAEFTARYLALLFGLIAMLACYHYGKKIGGSKTNGLLLMAICSFNFFHIYYSIEGRFYSLLFLLSLICTAEFYLYFKEEKRKHAIIYFISSILLCYTHYYGGILLASLSIVALVYFIIKSTSKKLFLQFVGVQFLVLLAFAPCIPYLIGKTSLESWMSDPTIGDFFNYYYLYSGKNPLEFAWLFLPLLFYFKVGKDKNLKLLLYLSIILGFLLPYLVSKIGSPMLHKRYTLIYLPAIYIMSMQAWRQLSFVGLSKSKWIYGIVAVSCILNIAFLRDEFRDDSKDQWKEVAQFLAEEKAEHIVADQAHYLNFYLNREGLSKATMGLSDKECWVLKTNFDEMDPLKAQNVEILEEKEFPKDFRLYKVSVK